MKHYEVITALMKERHTLVRRMETNKESVRLLLQANGKDMKLLKDITNNILSYHE